MSAGEDRPLFLTRPTVPTNSVGLDRARRLAWLDVQRTDQNQKLSASADPTHSNWIHKLDLGREFRLLYGRIVDEIAYANCYKVQLERGVTSMWCTAATMTALHPIGAKQLGQIPIGAAVILALHPNDSSGIILGVIPDIQISSDAAMADFISQQGRSGLLVDSAHSFPLTLEDASMVTDWSAGRPLDTTSEGEFGHITETGLLEFIDSFMTVKRVDEECGIWHFFHDQLTRLAGHNLQIWTAGYEREDLDDEGEVNIVEGYTPYYWESLGAFGHSTTTSRDIPTADWQKDAANQGYAALEPTVDNQSPFYRYRAFFGYLGQATKRSLCLPPDTTDINTLPDESIFPGVFEENLSLTGRWSVRSAHEIIFSKHIMIPTAKQIVKAEDPNGDKATNYTAAGILGTGAEHIVQGEIDVPVAPEDPTQIRAAGFLDTHAFVFNWIGLHPFHYHELDWFLPEEAELTYLGPQGPQFDQPEFDRLACHQFIPAPTAIPINVDHRYGEVKYYPNHSYFGMLADGGIVLGCGFGSEIRLANGQIKLTAPGDICIEAGRSIINLAGFDVVLRAKNSWDISATNHDGRLQAKHNLQLAATGDCGGVLIQSFALAPYCEEGVGESQILGGVSIKAEHSLITVHGKHVGLKLSEDSPDNVLIFDAGWEGRIKFKGKYTERFMHREGAAIDFWVIPESGEGPQTCTGSVTKGIELWQDIVIVPQDVVVDAKLVVTGCCVVKENIISTNGHVATSKAEMAFGKVGIVDANDIDALYDDITLRTETDLLELGNIELLSLCDRQKNFICDANFKFRTADQYRTNNYIFFESRWQQLARLGNVPTTTWAETDRDSTSPYPGFEILHANSYRTLDPQLYDLTTSVAADRGTAYENPEFAVPVHTTLIAGYSVII